MGLGKENITQRTETVRKILHSFTFIGLYGAFAKLRRATISFVMSVCPSVRLSAWNNSAHIEWTSWNLIQVHFEKVSRKFNFH
jgi:hypothetical protein